MLVGNPNALCRLSNPYYVGHLHPLHTQKLITPLARAGASAACGGPAERSGACVASLVYAQHGHELMR
jgi:hypothetical protein